MFKKIITLMFALLVIAFFSSNITEAQTSSSNTKITYPVFSVCPLLGVQFPVGMLNNTYKPSFVGGLDLNLKINRETAFFINASYYDMPIKTELQGPGASVIGITVGPRYTFTSSSIKAQFFLEAGLGVYMFHTQDYTTTGTPSYTFASSTTSNFGFNVGPGVIIPMGNVADLMLKVKIHDILASGGSSSFITGVIGVDFKL